MQGIAEKSMVGASVKHFPDTCSQILTEPLHAAIIVGNY